MCQNHCIIDDHHELLVLVKTGTDDQPKPTPATDESKNNGDPVK